MTLRKIGPDEFARRLKTTAKEPDKRFAFFLGAGCSVSSGIPAARTLVRDDWLPRLRDLRAPNRKDTDKWAKEEFPDYKRRDPAAHYGTVMEKLFLDDESRQREIERLCDGKFPGFGYAVLAGLMAQASGCFSAVVTTNFDDLISDALYLFTESRPLVIQHESLAGYIRSTRTRPLVVKLHGDHRLSPHSTAEETARLAEAIENQVRSLLHDRGLIFIGYGGRDEGILRMLDALPTNALPLGVYWVSAKEPRTTIRGWLEKRRAIWVEKQDFDELMLLIKDACALAHPDEKRLEKVFRRYIEMYASLSGRIASMPDTAPAAPALKAAARRIDDAVRQWWSVEVAASRVKGSDPEEAGRIYEDGLERFPKSVELLGNYAVFLRNVRKDYERAEEMFRRAMELEPQNATSLGNYALFLHEVRKDYERAEEMYRRALELEPQDATNLGNYALFLQDVRKDYERAEEMYRRALEPDPQHANNLGNYAVFLQTERKDYDRAEEMYRRALELDPNDASKLCNYATLFTHVPKDYDRAEEMFRRAMELEPNDANHLGNYANFLAHVRKDYDKAEQMHRRAMELDPNDANHLGNYAGFLLSRGHREEGLALLERVIEMPELAERTDLPAECWFYAFAHRPAEQQLDALANLKRVLVGGGRSPGWDLSQNIERARQDGHPDVEWLEKLAKVIAEGADISILDGWGKWRNA